MTHIDENVASFIDSKNKDLFKTFRGTMKGLVNDASLFKPVPALDSITKALKESSVTHDQSLTKDINFQTKLKEQSIKIASLKR